MEGEGNLTPLLPQSPNFLFLHLSKVDVHLPGSREQLQHGRGLLCAAAGSTRGSLWSLGALRPHNQRREARSLRWEVGTVAAGGR